MPGWSDLIFSQPALSHSIYTDMLSWGHWDLCLSPPPCFLWPLWSLDIWSFWAVSSSPRTNHCHPHYSRSWQNIAVKLLCHFPFLHLSWVACHYCWWWNSLSRCPFSAPSRHPAYLHQRQIPIYCSLGSSSFSTFSFRCWTFLHCQNQFPILPVPMLLKICWVSWSQFESQRSTWWWSTGKADEGDLIEADVHGWLVNPDEALLQQV